jgi:hypothetical protein
MVDETDSRGLGVDAALAITHDVIIAPGRLPQFVGNFDVFFGNRVSTVVLRLFGRS